MSRRIEVAVTRRREFEGLFAYVLKNIPLVFGGLIQSASNDHGGDGKPPGGPPPPALLPPESAQPAENTHSNKCERDEKICVSTKNHKISVEFKVKCENMPEFVFSTEGEASMKLGHVAVSLTAD